MERLEDSHNWKEWCSLSALTENIPQQFQHGLFVAPLHITCLDAFPDHLALGTNVGLVYVAHLPSFNLMRLKCENVNSPVTTVSAVSSVDDMIAAGCLNGRISIFQLPTSLPPSALHGKTEPEVRILRQSPKRFTVNIHNNSSVTCLRWSTNGMRLFSGDCHGNVGLIEIDYGNCECTGKLILKVTSQVVQLSYCHQLLAISFEERCILYNLRDEQTTVIGKKPRVPPGRYGCTFASSLDKPLKDVLYCARPGLKIWSSDTDGTVLYSYIHKKSPDHSVIKLMKIKTTAETADFQQSSKISFGLLHHIKDSILVSCSEKYLIILDVSNQKVLGYSEEIKNICDVAVCSDYIFVLENFKDIICISPYQPRFGERRLPTINMTRSLQENLNFSSFTEITSKVILPNKHLIDGITKFGETVASKISEIANPAIIAGNKNWSESLYSQLVSADTGNEVENLTHENGLRVTQSLAHQSQELCGTDDAEEQGKLIGIDGENMESLEPLVMQPSVKRKTKKKVNNAVVKQNDASTLETVEQSDNIEESNIIAGEEDHLLEENNVSEMAVGNNFPQDSGTYDDFKRNIEEKEKVLADVLDLSCLKMDHEEEKNKKTYVDHVSAVAPDFTRCSSACDENCPIKLSENELKFGTPKNSEDLGSASDDSFRYSHTIDNPNPLDSSDSKKYSSYGPPSGSSMPASSVEGLSSAEINITAVKPEEVNIIAQCNTDSQKLPSEVLSCGWLKFYIPCRAHAMGSSRNMIFFCENSHLYFANTSVDDEACHVWRKRRLPVDVQKFYFSRKEGEILLQTRDGLFRVETQTLFRMEPLKFKFLAEDICYAAGDQRVLWLLRPKNVVFAQSYSEEGNILSDVKVSCSEITLTSIVSHSGVTWGLASDGTVAYRIGVCSTASCGLAWGLMSPHQYQIKCIHLSDHGLGWMIDSEGQIFFKVFVGRDHPQGMDEDWWQSEQSDFMMVSEEYLMTSTETDLWISDKGSHFTFVHSITTLSGHRWHQTGEEIWAFICAEGRYDTYGSLFCLDSDGQLFAINPSSNSVLPVAFPRAKKLVCVSSRPEALWILTDKGKIFIRTGLSVSSALGLNWVELDLREIADICLVHLSLGMDVVWAVDREGRVYMRQGPLSPPKKKGLAPGWLHVDSAELKYGASFSKVFVGNKFYQVWGIDSNKKIYVREAIFQELSTGTSWVLVPGMLATSITISEDRVYILTPCGAVYERLGVSSSNYIGDSWKKIPLHAFQLASISVSVDNVLWGLSSSGNLWKHTSQIFVDGQPFPEAAAGVCNFAIGSDADDWEII